MLTVWGERWSLAAASRLVSPSPTSRTTWSSDSVRPAHPRAGRAEAERRRDVHRHHREDPAAAVLAELQQAGDRPLVVPARARLEREQPRPVAAHARRAGTDVLLAMAKRIHPRKLVRAKGASLVVMISRPKLTTEVILAAARAAAR
jgi:hypothetical protein